jgi:hypothetical protein
VSYVHVNYVLGRSKTTGMARLLLLIIADRTNKQTGYAFPSYECLARDMNTDMRSFRRALKEIPADELEVTPGGSEKGQKRRPTQYRILINCGAPNTEPTVRNTRMVKHNNNDRDRAQYAHGEDNRDRAQSDLRPCAKEPSDRAQYAHLTIANRNKRTKEAARARTRETAASPHSKPASSFFSESYFEQQQGKHSRLDVRALFPAAEAKCAENYPNGGPMKRKFFENYLDVEEQKLGPPGLLEDQQRKQEQREEAARDRMEADQQREMDEAEDIQRPPMNLKQAVVDQIKRLRERDSASL